MTFARAIVLTACFSGCRSGGGTACDYAKPACPRDQVCAGIGEGRTACVPFAVEPRVIPTPFDPGHAFWCSQGPRSAAGRSHSFAGDVFAVDLVSPLGSDAANVVAPVDGDAFVFDGCEERDHSPTAFNSSPCGLGYGNHVRIWDGTNIYLLAHLSSVLVRGGRVHRGQPIGMEGASGLAGHRHVHLTVTRPTTSIELQQILSNPGFKGSIPVRYRLAVQSAGGARADTWVDDLRCADDSGSALRYLSAEPP